MACAAVLTGHAYLQSMLGHIDCQAQSIGSYGYAALAAPGSPLAALIPALLALFIALFGLRLMMGEELGPGDVIGGALRIGIVLTLALSWPGWRVAAYDLVFAGSTELSQTIGVGAGLLGAGSVGARNLDARLQNADDGIVALTMFGSGRLTNGVVGSNELGSSDRGIALADQTGLGWGRVLFLVGTIAPLAIVRLGAGILLALAPAMAGLLLFAGTRALFVGWLRALAGCAIGMLALTLCYGAELAILQPWLSDALSQRQSNVLVPSAPSELLATTLAFLLIAFGVLGLIMRMSFFAGDPAARWGGVAARWLPFGPAIGDQRQQSANPDSLPPRERVAAGEASRVQGVAQAVTSTMDRERRLAGASLADGAIAANARPSAQTSSARYAGEALGSSYRRTNPRRSQAAASRDAKAQRNGAP